MQMSHIQVLVDILFLSKTYLGSPNANPKLMWHNSEITHIIRSYPLLALLYSIVETPLLVICDTSVYESVIVATYCTISDGILRDRSRVL